MFKILQARLQQYVDCELPDVETGFTKDRGARDKIANIRWFIKKSKRVPEKNIYFFLIDYIKASDCVDHNTVKNSSRDGNTRPAVLPHKKSVCRLESNS